jgi:phosphate-selective porin OprO/OprP
MQKQMKEMHRQMQALQAKMEKMQKAPSNGAVKGDVKISMTPSPKIESTDGKYSFQPFGRAHLDYSFADDDKRDNPDNMNLRRARLGFKGKVDEDFKYKFEMDFAGENVAFKDVSLTYTGLEELDIQAGHFKPVFGLEENTSSNYIQFIERAAPVSAFARDEELGTAIRMGDDNWSFATGIWNEDAGNTSTADDEAWSVDTRGSYAPVNEKGKVVHVAVGNSYRRPNAGSDSASFSSKGETGIGARLVNTGTISMVKNVTVYNAELAGVYDSLSLQGEYYTASVSREGAPDADFNGWYTQAAYLLTGEARPYKGKTGNFSRVKPKNPFSLKTGGTGAWEILARRSQVDLNDANAGILGGEMDNTTLGVNWYINNNTRLMANYVMVDTDQNAPTPDDDPNIFTVRGQWDF